MSSPGTGNVAAHGIAVVGLAGRFPGAPDVERLWEGLLAGAESITFFDPAELAAAGVPAETAAAANYVPAKAVVADPDCFDAAFFGFSPREAELLDPQHRLLLECSWHALEHAGYDPRGIAGPVGVFAGAGSNTYLLWNLQTNREALRSAGSYQAMLGGDDHFLATRVSYKLGLRGPSLTVQTACSSALVAVHLAVQSLLNGECDLALAGGVRVSVPQRAGHLYQPGGILSPDGRCRPFDVAARGSVDGDGAGVVVLKRLGDALADGDPVHAVILGSAVNNDGALKVGYTAPSVEGQAEVIAMALAMAGVEPSSIGFVEAHGTATPLGDPIEVAALHQVFAAPDPQRGRRGSCALGSVKGNIGHLDAAAGIASLIKAVLAVERGLIPPTLHFERPNPQLELASGPFYVNTRPAAWAPGLAPRRAGVSSFGIGGTNAHVVLEEPPPRAAAAPPPRPRQLLVLSAATAGALEDTTAALADHLAARAEKLGAAELADLAFTLQVGRGVFTHRRTLVCEGAEDAAAALRSLDPRRVLSRVQEPVSRPVAFLFPGQGAQAPDMGRELYEREPTFRREVDRGAELLAPRLGFDLRRALFPASPEARDGQDGRDRQDDGEAAVRLRQTAVAQPALFVVEHALAKLWMEWGVRPAAMLGHSVGELVAACLAGVLAFEDALRLVAERGRLMQEMPAGGMLAVSLPEAELAELLATWPPPGVGANAPLGGAEVKSPLGGAEVKSPLGGAEVKSPLGGAGVKSPLGGAGVRSPLGGAEVKSPAAAPEGQGLALAAVNTPALCTVAGAEKELAALAACLGRRGIQTRRLATSHGFHSPAMAPAAERFAAAFAGLRLAPPAIPFVSNLTGTWVRPEEATDPAYWARQLRSPVRFSEGLATLAARPELALLEVGPGRSLSALARRHPARPPGQRVLSSLPHHSRQAEQAGQAGERAESQRQPAEEESLLQALGELWLAGVEVDWKGFHSHARRSRVALPGYPFERRRFWIDPPSPSAPWEHPGEASGGATAGPLFAGAGEAATADPAAGRFWAPLWKQTLPVAPGRPARPDRPAGELVDAAQAKRSEQAAADRFALAAGEPWLVLAAEDFGGRLAEELRRSGRRVVVARPGERFRKTGAGEVELRPGASEDYRELLSETGLPARIAHLWSLAEEEDPARLQELGFFSLLALAGALGPALGTGHGAQPLAASAGRRRVHLGVVSAGAQQVAGEGLPAPVKATLLGPVAVLPQEIAGLSSQAIDLVPPAPGSAAEWALLDRLIAELEAAPAEAVVAYRGAGRFVRTFEALRLGPVPAEDESRAGATPSAAAHAADPAGPAPSQPSQGELRHEAGPELPGRRRLEGPLRDVAGGLRRGGSYLITGGLGGVGLELAELLAREAGARLTLVGRSPVPPRERWEALAAGGGAPSLVWRRLLALEALGAEVLALQADVTDRQAMRQALAASHLRFGPLHGAVHAAGVAGGGLAQLRRAEEARAVLAPKVAGTLVLAELLAPEKSLDFLLLCSSLNAILGGPGQIDYAAANAFLGAFAEARSGAGRPRVLAVDWDAWRGTGMAAHGRPEQPERPEPGHPAAEVGHRPADGHQEREILPLAHPLLDGRTAGSRDGEELFISRLRADTTWVLDEHRLGGYPVLPGTAYLEMAGVAFLAVTAEQADGEAAEQQAAGEPAEQQAASPRQGRPVSTERAAPAGLAALVAPPEGRAFELRHVTFLAPLAVVEGETREVRTLLRAPREGGEGWHFSVRSQAAAGGWQEHVSGVAAPLAPAAGRVDLPALLAGRREITLGEEYREELRRAGLGSRWEGLRKVWVVDGTGAGPTTGQAEASREADAEAGGEVRASGGHDAVALLELAPELAGDVDRFHLHPALLDAATSFAEAWVPHEKGDYLPLSYRRLAVRAALPRRFYSHARLRTGGAAGGTLAFDLQLCDEEGRELVTVSEFTLRRVDTARALRQDPRLVPLAPPAPESEMGAAGAVLSGAGVATAAGSGGAVLSGAGAWAEEGLTAGEAVEAFRRLLAGPHLPRIAVSRRPLPEEFQRARRLTLERLTAAERPAGAGGGGHARPDLATPYVAPRGRLEERLAATFESLLGISGVGAHDDFFSLGGHSLIGTQLLSRVLEELGVELPLARLFEAPTVAGLAAAIAVELGRRPGGETVGDGLLARPPAPGASILPRARRPEPRHAENAELPLSSAQERFWFLDRLEPGNPFYNVAQNAWLEGRLEVVPLAWGLDEIVRRHEVLRTVFPEVAGGVRPRILDASEAPAVALPVVDLAALPPGRRETEAERLAVAASLRSFDLARLPLVAATLFRLARERHLLSLTMHHIVSDGWSIGVFLGELASLYRSFVAGEPPALPPLAVQYADYAVWQRERLRGPELEEHLAALRARLAGPLPVLALPTDRPRPAVRSFLGAAEPMAFSSATTAAFKALCQNESATLFMGLLAAFAVLLQRHTGQDDLIVGSPVAGRQRRELEGLIGVFLNTLVLRADLSGRPSFRELVSRLRETTLEAYSRQEFPFERLVEELRPERDPSRTPVFQVLFDMQDFPRQDLELPGLRLTAAPLPVAPARFDLTLHAAEVAGRLHLELEHSAVLFERATAARWLERFATLLEALAADPAAADREIDELPLLPASDREQLLAWSRGAELAGRAGPGSSLGATIHARFAVQARRSPRAVAVADGAESLTYAELDGLSRRVARRLLAAGVAPESRVAVALPRGTPAIVALLGVLRAGCAYLPLDLTSPADRLLRMLDDAGAAVLIAAREPGSGPARDLLASLTLRGGSPRTETRSGTAPGSAAPLRLDIEELADPAAGLAEPPAPPAGAAGLDPEDPSGETLAYVIYTSGSTGVPKGVAVPHRAVLRLVDGDCAAFGPDEVWGQLAPLSFDAATLEIWGALLHGGRLEVLADTAVAGTLGAALAGRGVSALWLTAGLFHLVVEEELGALAGLRQLLAGGDVLSPEAVRRTLAAHPHLRLANGYGPTENTTFTCCCPLAGTGWEGSVPLGRPIAGTTVQVLDGALRPVPPGAAGELCTGGLGLARGYLGRPELTAERFVPDPSGMGARLYRTGDRARFRRDGALEFLGRIDRQVKIRGFRVEPEEVEALLAGHPAVRQAVVAVRAEGASGRRLVAWIVTDPAAGPPPEGGTFAAWLAERLPPYMVPAAIVQLAELPLTPNGKVDRPRLPDPGAPGGGAGSGFEAPATATEQQLGQIWSEVLEVPRVGRGDSFFALGGHSLLVLRAIARIRAAFRLEVPARLLFEASTLAELAAWIDQQEIARADRAELEALLAEVAAVASPPSAH